MENNTQLKELLHELQSEASHALVVDDDKLTAAYNRTHKQQSITVKVLSIVGGIFVSSSLFSFLFLGGIAISQLIILFAGPLAIIASLYFCKKQDKIILDTVWVSFFIMGFILIGQSLAHYEFNDQAITYCLIALSVISIIVVDHYVLCFLAALLFNACIIYRIVSENQDILFYIYVALLAILICYVFLNEARLITQKKFILTRYNALKTALLFSFIGALAFMHMGFTEVVSTGSSWIISIVCSCVILYLANQIFKIIKIVKLGDKLVCYAFCVLILAVTVLYPGISGAFMLLLLCFLVNYKTGFAISALALIYFISQFYYDLYYSLLTKSILLFSTGIFFIMLYLFTTKNVKKHENI